jgi:oxygen-independent coproporphyrinogen-3 oxidase
MSDVAATLLRKYSVPGPRYTSYPTVPHWDTTPTETQWLQHVEAALGAADTAAALYVHIPFCHALCTFCGCNMRVTRNHALVTPYIETVLAEHRTLLERLGRTSLPLGQVYLGGGTPTYLHADELELLLAGLFGNAPLAPGASLSLEVDPRITTRQQLSVLRSYQFTGISLGVQDFDPRVQDIVNRAQSEEQVQKVTEDARALGFRSVNFDLIYGLPLQTRDSIEATMDAVLRLRPDRIAFYPYAHVPWIRPSQRRFTEADLPEGDARRGLQELGRERMLSAGYVEIGMDHFALPHDALARAADAGTLHRNFMGYAPRPTRPLLGLGVSSISDAETAFVQNEKNLQQYQERVGRGELPIQRGHVLGAEDRILRRHILRLATHYATDWNSLEDYTPFLDGATARLEELQRDGLVQLAPRSVQVTPAGRAFLRNVCMAFDARHVRRAQIAPLYRTVRPGAAAATT